MCANAQVANIDSAKVIIEKLVNSKFSSAVIETEVNRLHKDADQNTMSILLDIDSVKLSNTFEKTDIAFSAIKHHLFALNGRLLSISKTEIYDNCSGDKNPDKEFRVEVILTDLTSFKYFGSELVPCQYQISLIAAPVNGKWIYRTIWIASKQLSGAEIFNLKGQAYHGSRR
jgi:hypothetical protein